MIDTKIITAIIQWLQKHGEGDDINRHVSFSDPPWEDFYAEWQDWSFHESGTAKIYVGYHYEEYGDRVPDPDILVNLAYGEPKSISLATPVSSYMIEGREDLSYISHVLAEMWRRHFVPRLTLKDHEAIKVLKRLGHETDKMVLQNNRDNIATVKRLAAEHPEQDLYTVCLDNLGTFEIL